MTLPAFLQQAPPTVAVDIAPGRVAVTRLDRRGGGYVVGGYAVESLPDGAVSGQLGAPNMTDLRAVAAAVERACTAAGARGARVCVVVPDSIARVSIVHFDNVPARAADLDELIRWQVKKTTPFPLDEAVVAATPGAAGGSGRDFVVTVARRDVVEQYEDACRRAGCQAGVVDLATFNVINTVLVGERATHGDWLLVHATPTYVSLAVLRDGELIFYRTRGEDAEGSIADLVHQTAMYYEDRLQGRRFGRVLLAGGSTHDGADALRRELSDRLGLEVGAVDPFAAAALTGGRGSAELADTLAAGVGLVVREGVGG
ncbi:MAG: type IV pilus biogenesis protein PilM [Vicinamibacterales bacterium]